MSSLCPVCGQCHDTTACPPSPIDTLQKDWRMDSLTKETLLYSAQLKRERDEALLELKRYKNMASACVNCRANLSEVKSDE